MLHHASRCRTSAYVAMLRGECQTILSSWPKRRGIPQRRRYSRCRQGGAGGVVARAFAHSRLLDDCKGARFTWNKPDAETRSPPDEWSESRWLLGVFRTSTSNASFTSLHLIIYSQMVNWLMPTLFRSAADDVATARESAGADELLEAANLTFQSHRAILSLVRRRRRRVRKNRKQAFVSNGPKRGR